MITRRRAARGKRVRPKRECRCPLRGDREGEEKRGRGAIRYQAHRVSEQGSTLSYGKQERHCQMDTAWMSPPRFRRSRNSSDIHNLWGSFRGLTSNSTQSPGYFCQLILCLSSCQLRLRLFHEAFVSMGHFDSLSLTLMCIRPHAFTRSPRGVYEWY